MKNLVLIKSFQNGLSVYLDETISFAELLDEVAVKFKESSHFFKNAELALSFEGRKLTDSEERMILDTINLNSQIKIICLISSDTDKNKNYIHALKKIEQSGTNGGQLYKGVLKDGQILETDNTVIVLGDVYPGCSIISKKDIIILGGLYGEALGGTDREDGHIIVALEMSPEKLKIGEYRYKHEGRPFKWSIKAKIQPKIAYVLDGRVVIEPINKELLNHIPF